MPPNGVLNFKAVQAKTVYEKELPERVWLWDKYIPEGTLCLLAALPKTGKTTFVSKLLLALSRGEPFLGFKTKQTNILYLAVEENQYDVYKRLKDNGIQPPDPVHIHTGFLQMQEDELRAIEDYVKEHKIGFVVIDTLSHFWAIEDENDNSQVTKRMRRLLKFRDNTGVTILFLHHTRKNDGGGISTGTAIRGAGALLASVDQALMLGRASTAKNRRVLTSLGRYFDTPLEIIIELRDGKYYGIGSEQDTADVDNWERIMACLSERPVGLAHLQDKTGLTKTYLAKLIGRYGQHLKVTGLGIKGDPYLYAI